MKIAGIADLTFGLILSLSKDEAAVRPVDASSFDKLRMRRMQTFTPYLIAFSTDWPTTSPTATSRRLKSRRSSAPMQPMRKLAARVSLPG